MTHGHELRRGCWREGGYWAEGHKGGKIGTTVINKIYLKKGDFSFWEKVEKSQDVHSGL